jgi:DNA-binding winged helix-turn-helix (wHTH) protein
VTPTAPNPVRFGIFELDTEAGQLRREGRVVRLPPQPFKLLEMLTSKQGRLVTREDIRKALWPEDTFIDFEQGVNFAIKQVREALNDNPDNPLYIQTVPKRGYRFIAPIEGVGPAAPLKAHTTTRGGTTDLNLQKVLWTNIAELRMAEQRQREAEEARRALRAQRRARIKQVAVVAAAVAGVLVVVAGLWWVLR